MVRPRRVGTFLMSRRPTSAKLCGALEDALHLLARELVHSEQVLHASSFDGRGRVPAGVIATSSVPSVSSSRTFTRSPGAVGRFLPT